jgi:TRAP-type mannitol/chloroaromatic compound transport system permease large subunit
MGALIMAIARRKLSLDLLKQALENTTKLSCFVLFILIGSTVFSFTFNAAEGHIWVEHLFANMPGGAMGFLIVVNILVFILGMFIDFFEIAFIVIPMLAPVADKLLPALLPAGAPADWALIWFGVIIAMNLQTSFLTPPFGFALFYLRSVAARTDYKDRITGEAIPAVTTGQIYKGAIAFIVIQLIMVAMVIIFPQLVIDMETKKAIDLDSIQRQLEAPTGGYGSEQAVPDPAKDLAPGSAAPAGGTSEGAKPADDDPMAAMKREMERDLKK